RFFEGEDVAWRIAPFVIAGLLPFALLPFAGVSATDPRVLVAAVMVPIVIALALGVPWQRLPAWPQAILPLSYFVIIALLRDATGNSPSIFGPLVVLPVTWFAIYGTGRELGVAILVLAVTLLTPIAVIGGHTYNTDELQRDIVAIGLAATLGPAVHLLVVAL